MVHLATKTLAAIDAAIEADGGAAFRGLQRKAFDDLTDAFSTKEETFRTHLGASVIGRPCARDIWYSFHWAKKPTHKASLLRLFNRGHLEEARFVALLRLIGTELWTHTADGKQLRMGVGHFGGSLDSIIRGLPDLPDEPVLGEFKTHNDKSFSALVSDGVQRAKWEHYVQMNLYADAYQLRHSFYLAVNKNNDQLYGEIIPLDAAVVERYKQRAQSIIDSPEPPMRINPSPGWYQCKFCNHQTLCHSFEFPEINCRTCANSTPIADGIWQCETLGKPIGKDCTACERHVFNPTMLNNIEIMEMRSGTMVYRTPSGKIVDTATVRSIDLL